VISSAIRDLSDDGAPKYFAKLAKNTLRGRDPAVVGGGCALDEGLDGFFVEDAGVKSALVELAEGDEGGEGEAAVAAAEGASLEDGEDEGGGLVGERRIGLAAEGHELGAQHGVGEAELRVDDSRMRLMAAELDRDRPVQLDDVLRGQVADGVSR
jgi:hypothetical protein